MILVEIREGRARVRSIKGPAPSGLVVDWTTQTLAPMYNGEPALVGGNNDGAAPRQRQTRQVRGARKATRRRATRATVNA